MEKEKQEKLIIEVIRKCYGDIDLQELLIRRIVNFAEEDPLFMQKLKISLDGITTNIRGAVSSYEHNLIGETYYLWKENRKNVGQLPDISFSHLPEEYQNPSLSEYKSSEWIKIELAEYFNRSLPAINKAITKYNQTNNKSTY